MLVKRNIYICLLLLLLKNCSKSVKNDFFDVKKIWPFSVKQSVLGMSGVCGIAAYFLYRYVNGKKKSLIQKIYILENHINSTEADYCLKFKGISITCGQYSYA